MNAQQKYIKEKASFYKFDPRFVRLLSEIGEKIAEFEKENGGENNIGCAISTSNMERDFGNNLNLGWDGEKFTMGVWDASKPIYKRDL